MAIQLTMAEIGLESSSYQRHADQVVAVLFTHFFSAVEVDSLFYEYFIED
jgi:hypothetical protein